MAEAKKEVDKAVELVEEPAGGVEPVEEKGGSGMGVLGVEVTAENERSMLVAQDGAVSKPVTIRYGSNLKRGAVLGMLGAGYKGEYMYKDFDPAGFEGDQTPVAILANDVDASLAHTPGEALFQGKYRSVDLIWKDGISHDDQKAALAMLQDRGIVVDTDWV